MRPSVKLPSKVDSMLWMSHQVYPKWMFWKPRKGYLYASSGNTIYEIDSTETTLYDRAKTKVRYLSVARYFKSDTKVIDLVTSDPEVDSDVTNPPL